MDKLLHHYERELGRLREAARQFADSHPDTAAALELGPDASTDPEVERLFQSVALLNASMQQRIEEGRSEFHRGLLQTLQPHYLRPMPACGIVQVDTSGTRLNEISTVTRLPRGTILRSGLSRFATAYETSVAPIAVAEARCRSTIDLPSTLRLPSESTSTLAISLETTASSAGFDQPPLGNLRMFFDGEPALRAALLDAILAHSLCVCLEAGGTWCTLPGRPFSASPREPLLPVRPGPQSARLMAEFFHLPEMFGFVDLDLQAIAAACPPKCQRITLHVVLPGRAEVLGQVTAESVQLGCTPVVSLFPEAAAPIRTDGRTGPYPVTPAHDGCEIYSIDTVVLKAWSGEDVVMPFHGLSHDAHGSYWQLDEQEGCAISFVDREQRPVQLEAGTILAQLTCTNNHPPHRDAALTAEAFVAGFPVQFRHGPTQPARLAEPSQLCEALYEERVTLQILRKAFELHGCHYADSMKDLITKPSTAWLEHPMGRVHMHGTEFTVVVDEAGLRGHSIHVLAEISAICLADKLRENRFAQVRIANGDGRILLRAATRIGTRPLN